MPCARSVQEPHYTRNGSSTSNAHQTDAAVDGGSLDKSINLPITAREADKGTDEFRPEELQARKSPRRLSTLDHSSSLPELSDVQEIQPTPRLPDLSDAPSENMGKHHNGGEGGMEASVVSNQARTGNEAHEYSCGCIHIHSPIRRLVITTVEHPYFDRLVMVVILLNCITLALFDPLDRDCKTTRCQVRDVK